MIEVMSFKSPTRSSAVIRNSVCVGNFFNEASDRVVFIALLIWLLAMLVLTNESHDSDGFLFFCVMISTMSPDRNWYSSGVIFPFTLAPEHEFPISL